MQALYHKKRNLCWKKSVKNPRLQKSFFAQSIFWAFQFFFFSEQPVAVCLVELMAILGYIMRVRIGVVSDTAENSSVTLLKHLFRNPFP